MHRNSAHSPSNIRRYILLTSSPLQIRKLRHREGECLSPHRIAAKGCLVLDLQPLRYHELLNVTDDACCLKEFLKFCFSMLKAKIIVTYFRCDNGIFK